MPQGSLIQQLSEKPYVMQVPKPYSSCEDPAIKPREFFCDEFGPYRLGRASTVLPSRIVFQDSSDRMIAIRLVSAG